MYLTKQQIFDTVLTKLRAQGCASKLVNGSDCAYRGEGGMKCAVGHLMPDEVYREAWEGMNAMRLPPHAYEAMSVEFSEANQNFLFQLQCAHDGWLDNRPPVGGSLVGWEGKMEGIAREHSLAYTPAVQQ